MTATASVGPREQGPLSVKTDPRCARCNHRESRHREGAGCLTRPKGPNGAYCVCWAFLTKSRERETPDSSAASCVNAVLHVPSRRLVSHDATLPHDERPGAARRQIAVIDIAHVVIRRTAQHDCGNSNDSSHSTRSTDFTDERRNPPSPITSKEDLEARIAQRLITDIADPTLREAIATALGARGAPIAAATACVLGPRGIIVAALCAAEGDFFYGHEALESYALGRSESAYLLAHILSDLVDCPSCYVYEASHGPDEPFPCDPRAYAEQVAMEARETIARYAVGANISGYASYAPHGDFTVTRAVIASKKPPWWRGLSNEVRWNIDFDACPGYDHVEIPRTRRAEYAQGLGAPCLHVWFEFRRVDRVQPSLLT